MNDIFDGDLPRPSDFPGEETGSKPIIITDRIAIGSSASRRTVRRSTQILARQSRVLTKPQPRVVAPWWRQSGTVRTVTRWMLLGAAALAVCVTAILLPPPEDLPEPISRPALRVAAVTAPGAVPSFEQVHGAVVRDPFAYRPRAYTPPAPVAPAPVPAPVVTEPADPPLDTAGLSLAALALGQRPLASLQEGGRTRLVAVGDIVRGATVTAIDATGVSLVRGDRRALLTPRGGQRPLAMRPFRDGGQSATLRTRTPESRAAAVPAVPPPSRRRLGLAVRDVPRAVPGEPQVVIATVGRTDVPVEVGDGLLAIDDLPVASSADAMRLLADRRSAPAVVLSLRRGSTTLAVTVPWKE